MTNMIAKQGVCYPIADTCQYDTLVIEPGASFSAPAGKTLVMTAGGVETAIAPGTYANVILSARDEIRDIIDGYDGYDYSCALYVDKGGVNAGASHLSAISGTFDGKSMKNAAVRSENVFLAA